MKAQQYSPFMGEIQQKSANITPTINGTKQVS